MESAMDKSRIIPNPADTRRPTDRRSNPKTEVSLLTVVLGEKALSSVQSNFFDERVTEAAVKLRLCRCHRRSELFPSDRFDHLHACPRELSYTFGFCRGRKFARRLAGQLSCFHKCFFVGCGEIL